MAELEFRDEKREVPDYIADMMSGIETFKMTYKEALAEANRRMEARVIDRAVDGLRKSHFSGVPR